VEEKYLVLAEHAAQPVSEPKFSVGQKVKIVADLTGWKDSYAMVCAVNEVSGDICVLGDVAKEYRWYQPHQLKVEEKPQPKFKVGDRVQLDQTAPAHSNKIGSIVEVLENEEYSVKFDNHASAITVHSGRLTLAATNPKFKAGDRVYLSCDGHYHDKQTGTVIKQLVPPLETEVYTVQFDGHTCTHNLCADALLLVRFKVGEKVGWVPSCRFERFVHLEVLKILGRIDDLLVYQLKGTTKDGSVQIVSARENALFPYIAGFTEFAVGQQVYVPPDHPTLGKYAELRIRYREPGMTNDPKYALDCYEKNRLKHFVGYAKQSELMYCEPAGEPIQKNWKEIMTWAEGLILQLPQTHDGRNSWLINHSKASQEVITDPKAVVHLLTTNAVVRMQYEGLNTKVCETTLRYAEQLMKVGATFICNRKEKRQG
jgi:hypothetical protein